MTDINIYGLRTADTVYIVLYSISKGKIMSIAETYLELKDPAEKKSRFYRLTVFKNVYGAFQLDRTWGLIGTHGHIRHEDYNDIDLALLALTRVQSVKEKRGYVLLYQDMPSHPMINMIPKRCYPYLDVKLTQLLCDEDQLYRYAEKLLFNDVIYTGDLVQLSEHEIISYLATAYEGLKDLQKTTDHLMNKLKQCLYHYDLKLGAKVPGWSRPAPMRQNVFCDQLNQAVSESMMLVSDHPASQILPFPDVNFRQYPQ